ncbi:MAG: ClbS/DfsB family four-helix bundle protein [Aggregatilineales bacterium]
MADEPILSKAELIAKIQQGWDEFQAYLKTLTDAQLTTPKDAVGWTAKDHLGHLVAWEDSVYAILTKQPRREYMGVDRETWKSGDFDRINAVIQPRYAQQSLAEVLAQFSIVHQRVLAQIQMLSEDELGKPFNYFQPGSTNAAPVIGSIIGNTYEHYAEHKPWIASIVATPG